MEIIGFLIELIVNIIGAIIGLIDFIMFLEVASKVFTEPFNNDKKFSPFLAGVGYFCYGVLIGALSLLIPKLLTIPQWVRQINLIVSPLMCGLLMQLYGNYRKNSGKKPIRLTTFTYGFLFAFAMVLTRYIVR